MDCTDVEELAGAFALGAVPADETEEVVAHLAECPHAHRMIAELIEVAALLPYAVDEVEPPPRLRASLLAAALADPGATPSGAPPVVAPAGADRPSWLRARAARRSAAGPLPFRTARPARRLWMNPGIWAAAALLLLSVGLGAWNLDLRRSLDSRTAAAQQRQQVLAAIAAGARVVPLTASGSGIQATLVQPADGRAPYVVGNMPALPSGKAYEAWVIRGNQPVPAGVFRSSGFAVMTLHQDLAGAQAVAFTVEREQGSETPTLPIVAQAPVS